MSSRTGPGAPDVAFRVFVVATGLALLHAVDDAVTNRQPGVPVTQHLPGLGVSLLVAVGSVWLFRRTGTGVRSVLALFLGALTVANGAMHVLHVAVTEMSGSDVTGIVATTAGACLLGMAVTLPVLHRGARDLPPRRRWLVRAGVTLALAVVVPLGILPLTVGIGQTHLYRRDIGQPPAPFRTVTFEASDGLLLSGWYTPSRNGAAVIVVSSARGDRLKSVDHAEMLARHGFGVLLYDARGTGESEGSPNGYGWWWRRDVFGALDFLDTRPDVEPGRVGGLGLSTGADVLIEAAATDRRLAAVVADGATGRSLEDTPPGSLEAGLQIAPVFLSVALFSGERPGAPLADLAARLAPTPLLLVAAGSLPTEIEMNQVYAEAAREPVDLWTLPDAGHTAAIRDEATAYEARVVRHFESALLR